MVHVELSHLESVTAESPGGGAVEAEGAGITADRIEVVLRDPPPTQVGSPAALTGSPAAVALSPSAAPTRRQFTPLHLQRSQDDGAILRPRRAVRGAPPMAPRGKRIMPLDLDVIDVSWMDNNVHEMRHNFFNLNRWMIDDIREIIMTQRRARLRTSRMTHRFTNVWSFLAAPNHVVNP